MIRSTLLLGFLLLFLPPLQAQVGLSGSYVQWQIPDWEQLVEEEASPAARDALYRNAYKVGIDYWFRLKNVRVEFFPELAFSRVEADMSNWATDFDRYELRNQSLHVQLNTHFYVLDFFGDCDCPTFSKQDPFLQKGFYLELSPGIARQHFQRAIETSDFETYGTTYQFTLAAGAGVDIGVSEFLTVTPYIRAWYFFNAVWPELRDLPIYNFTSGPAGLDIAGQQYWLELGLRLGIRWDQ